MKFTQKISPPFLKRADIYLRKNHPWIWATKVHLHIYLAFLLACIFSLVGLFYNIDVNQVPTGNDQDVLFNLLFVPAALFGVFIIYNMSLFNPDKSAAYRFKYQEFFLFLIYIFSFFLPFVIPYSAGLILNERISALVSDETYEQDVTAFNYGRIFFRVQKHIILIITPMTVSTYLKLP
ncbi:MAG: hypothetical protein H0X62_01470 [Bacteroidetes bacterium]|nr:hypothetical protein [Bacteroidota bacterium]